MENDKYFTPDIEDMSVGCEFEMDDTWGGWKKLTLTKELLVNPMVGLGSGNERSPWYHRIRVPYLTKEQIEAEGWKLDSSPDSNEMHFIKKIKKSRHYLEFYPNTTEVIINKINTESLPFKCKDINTFRKIIKLL